MLARFAPAAFCLAALFPVLTPGQAAQSLDQPRKIVLIAGTKSHGPGHHEYERGCRILKECLERAKGIGPIVCELHLDGWPADETTLDDADTILIFCDGPDRDPDAHPILRGERLATIGRQMKRGCGLVALHYAVFAPNDRGGPEFLDWMGGYFDYQSGPAANGWFSKIATHTTTPEPASPEHPICLGLEPFELTEEFYYNIRFRDADPRRAPILTTPIPGELESQVVAWAVERDDGGRGFGFTGGHFHSNWGVENFRKLVLNSLLWTAHVEVPVDGLASNVEPESLATPSEPKSQIPNPKSAAINALIVTGHNHPAHDWRATTKALEEVLGRDPRIAVTVVADPQVYGQAQLADYDLIVQNYVNWERPGLDAAARDGLLNAVREGKGLAMIHFANGAFSDWPEYRQLARRVWVEGQSGHDPYGAFHVAITGVEHEITAGLAAFDTTDELYFNQQGELPIEPLATAKSTVTGNDEPMAFAYEYGKGRIFQTVLGHDAAAILNGGTSELIRRGAAWAAGAEQVAAADRPRRPATIAGLTADGRFGRAFDPAQGQVGAAARGEYREPPLTVECWARLNSKRGFNVLVASDPKESSTHWELYSYAGSGAFSVYLPGFAPSELVSPVEITDGRWHYVAFVYRPGQAELYVDARRVFEAEVKPVAENRVAGPLWFGSYPPHSIGCDGLVDEVRISNAARTIDKIPDAPFEADGATIGLWHFDETAGDAFADTSLLANAARPSLPNLDASSYRASDRRHKVDLIDRSPRESFLSLRLDTDGRLFAGGREALFAYDRLADGSYGPRHELYRFPPHSWITDIEILGDDLYVMTASAIYVMPGGRVRRDGLAPQRIIWGQPVDLHVTLHGLAWGPEGDLYFATGDPLLNYGDFTRPDHWGHWTFFCGPEGTRVPYTGQGGVFRCRPDGSGLRCIARGLRGSDGLAFDAAWNLFTNDNDHESLPASYVPARLLHVTPHCDFGWPRGWMPRITPHRADLLDMVYDGMGRGVPVALAYYDEPLLSELRGNLLMPRWDQRTVAAYPLEAAGASFTASERAVLTGDGNARPVGVAVGPDGRIFAAISYMAQNEGSPTYVSDLVVIGPADESPSAFVPYDVTTVAEGALWSDLSHDSWNRRYRAHLEILRRGGEYLKNAAPLWFATPPKDPAMRHMPWLIAASGRPSDAGLLAELTAHDDAAVRLQAVRALGDFARLGGPWDLFIRALEDESPHVQLAAVVALYDRRESMAPALLAGPARSTDRRLRQTACGLLAEQMPLSQLAELARANDSPGRLAAALAAGYRLTVPPALGPLPNELPLNYYSTNALFELDYPGERIDIRTLGRVGSFTIAEKWKALPRSSEEDSVVEILSLLATEEDQAVRLQAAWFLRLLNDPRTEPIVADVNERFLRDRLANAPATALDRGWAIGPFVDGGRGFATAHPPEQGAIDLSAEYAAGDRKLTWLDSTRLNAEDFFSLFIGPNLDDQSIYSYTRLMSTIAQPALLKLGRYEGRVRLWHNGRLVDDRRGIRLELQPGSNDLLIRFRGHPVDSDTPFRIRAASPIEVAMPERLTGATLAERLKEASTSGDTAALSLEFLDLDWPAQAAQGDAARGRLLFGRDGLGCVKCHAIAAGQSAAGAPSLEGSRNRFTIPHLVESVLLPSKQVAPLFQASAIETTEGLIVTGLVTSETADIVEVLLPDATRRTIPQSQIDSRELQELSPMPAGLVKTPAELADLLAYLLSENPPP